MYGRGLVIWLSLMVVAVVNGGTRNAWVTPALGEGAGHVISSITLSIAILAVAWLTNRWIGVSTATRAWALGGYWLLLTVSFEFLAGHYVFGHPWDRLLADYDLAAGRIWAVVLVTTLLAPRIVLAKRSRGST